MPTTDWQLIRTVLIAAVDACEAADRLGFHEEERSLPTGTGANVWDVLTSAWTYPENLRYAIIRARHDLDDDALYRPELARALTEAGAVCAELVGVSRLDDVVVMADGAEGRSVRQLVEGMAEWYRQQMIPQLTSAAGRRTPAADRPAV